jgi:hypothetical protein
VFGENTMKNAIAILFVAASLATHSAASQIVTLTASKQTVSVSPTDIVQVITIVSDYESRPLLFQNESGTFFSISTGMSQGGVSNFTATFTGLTQVGLSRSSGAFDPIPITEKLTVTLRISKAAEEFVSQPVIMPAVTDQNYKVELEASTDLQDWIPAVPGDYLGGATNRFFRVKVSKKP